MGTTQGCHSEQIPEAGPHKTDTIWLLASYFTNNSK